MAEFLVYAKRLWIEEDPDYLTKAQLAVDAQSNLTPAEKIADKERILQEYEARPQPGDIVEARPDGYWGEPDEKNKHGWNHKAFALVKVLGLHLSENQLREYMKSVKVRPENAPMYFLKNRKYTVVALSLKPGETRVIDKLKDMRIEAKVG